ncbi:MAG TPA: glycosyltransferase family 2 protein [Candidatus Acidoferrum sp.]|nr:glycosyltransferase family 2 protein [Candidatus Acidoferrum sp.]
MTQPSVAVVVLNWNGRHHLEACLASLQAQTYAGPRQVVVMDNGSTDGSADFVRSRFPDVRLIRSEENLGFAGGNNYAVARLDHDVIAFLNNDTRADPRWLEELLVVLTGAPDVAAAAGKILSWDGKRIDFVAGGATLTGFGLQLGWGEMASEYDSERDILVPCGGSMVIWREVFDKVGRFDDDYFLFYEDVDLGWRLWLAGYRVRSAPKSVVYHKHHGDIRRIDDQRKAVLYDRNPLYTIFKNYDDEHLAAILPAAILLTTEKATLMSNPNRAAYRLPMDGRNSPHVIAPPKGEGSLERSLRERGLAGTAKRIPAAFGRRARVLGSRVRQRLAERLSPQRDMAAVPRTAISSLLAVEQFGEHLPVLQRKRAAVQALRRRTDAEILKLFGLPLEPLAPVDGFADYHRRVMQTLGLDRWVSAD